MANEDDELRKAHAQWLASRPKSFPRSSSIVLDGAERRLLGSIKRGDPRPKLVANAERVRRSQLGRLKATDLIAELPTDVDDEQRRRHRENLEKSRADWVAKSVDDIIALYARELGR